MNRLKKVVAGIGILCLYSLPLSADGIPFPGQELDMPDIPMTHWLEMDRQIGCIAKINDEVNPNAPKFTGKIYKFNGIVIAVNHKEEYFVVSEPFSLTYLGYDNSALMGVWPTNPKALKGLEAGDHVVFEGLLTTAGCKQYRTVKAAITKLDKQLIKTRK